MKERSPRRGSLRRRLRRADPAGGAAPPTAALAVVALAVGRGGGAASAAAAVASAPASAFLAAAPFSRGTFSSGPSRTSLSLSSSSEPSPSRGRLSASARARRDEDRRRMERRGEVAPGRTSARPGESDYVLDVEATERQYLSSVSDAEREVYLQTERGMEALRMLQLEEAKEAFDAVYALKPDAYLWQAGVVQYYLDDLHGAANTFAANAALYESKFLCPASEERIWRDACQLRIESSMGKRERGALVDMKGGGGPEGAREGETSEGGGGAAVARVPKRSGMAVEMMTKETRKVLRLARDLFSASVRRDHSAVALARASLRSICGAYGSPPSPDIKMWRLHSWYYLGLHYDAIGDPYESKRCMKMALRQSAAGGNGRDIVQTLPVLHMTRRDWYDDDEFAEDGGAAARRRRASRAVDVDADVPTAYRWSSMNSGGGGDGTGVSSGSDDAALDADVVARDSIANSVDGMKLAELRDALRRRNIRSGGSKAELRRRLTDSLLRDAGLEG